MGAQIERGRVTKETEGRYILESLDRPGVTTMPLKDLLGETYQTGDRVLYAFFPDGDGMIFGKL